VNTSDSSNAGPSQPIPTISVTRPPVPKPISIPRPDDIPIDMSPSHNDLESGVGGISMREVETALPAVPVPPKALSPKSAGSKPTSPIVPPAVSPYHAPSRQSTDDIISPTKAEVADLLADASLSDIPTEPLNGLTVDSPVLVSSEDASGAAGDETFSNDGVLVSDAETETETPEVIESQAKDTDKRSSVDST
jgi:hypothetical protein